MMPKQEKPDFIKVENDSIFSVRTHTSGPKGHLDLSDTMLKESPSGDLFGLSQNAGMGWSPKERLPSLTNKPDSVAINLPKI